MLNLNGYTVECNTGGDTTSPTRVIELSGAVNAVMGPGTGE